MKTPYLISILSVAAGLSLRAQSPNDSTSTSTGQPSDRREHFQKMAEHHRWHHHDGGEGQSMGREEHIREALKHLKAAGLDRMADRIEEAMKKMCENREHSPAQSKDQQPPMPQPRGQFGSPAPLPPGAPAPMREHGGRPHTGNNDDLQVQVQRLARQVEELRNLMLNRMEKYQGQNDPRGSEHRKHRPDRDRAEEVKPAIPQPRPIE